MITPEQKEKLDDRFKSLDIFAWCVTCATLLIGAEKHDSFWGKKTTAVGQLHRRGTNHEVYIGPKR